MTKQDVYKILDDMINAIKPEALKNCFEIWISNDLYSIINITEYKKFKVYTSGLMPKDYAFITEGKFVI